MTDKESGKDTPVAKGGLSKAVYVPWQEFFRKNMEEVKNKDARTHDKTNIWSKV